jgi:hypothetical protein
VGYTRLADALDELRGSDESRSRDDAPRAQLRRALVALATRDDK